MADLNYKQLDPTKCISNMGGHTIRGWADGEMVAIAFDSPKRSKHVGVDGAGRHIKNNDRSGTITVRLQGASPSNAALQALDILDVPYSYAMVDKSSNGDSFFAGSVTLQTEPPMTRGDSEEIVEWVYQFTNGKMIRAGAEAESLLAAITASIPGF